MHRGGGIGSPSSSVPSMNEWRSPTDKETPKTLRELQKLPDELKAVARAIGHVEGILERAVEQGQRSQGEDDG